MDPFADEEPTIGEIGPQPAPGPYLVRLEKIEREESKQKPGEFYLRWTFYAGKDKEPFKPTSSESWGKRSKAFKWARAIMQTDPSGHKPRELFGKTCVVMIEHDEDGYAYVADVGPHLAPEKIVPTMEDVPLPDVTDADLPG